MKRNRSSLLPQSQFEIGFIAMPVLSCLLAGSLMIWIESSLRREVQTEMIETGAGIEELVAALNTETDEHTRLRMEAETIYLKLSGELLSREIGDRRDRVKLLEEITALEDDIAGLTEKVESLEGRRHNAGEKAGLLVGDYAGDYIVVECFGDGVIIHPGKGDKHRLRTQEQRKSLFGQVEVAGFVAILVRPSGWDDAYFNQVKDVIYDHLDDLEAKGTEIGRTTLPITGETDIAQYLPRKPEHVQ